MTFWWDDLENVAANEGGWVSSKHQEIARGLLVCNTKISAIPILEDGIRKVNSIPENEVQAILSWLKDTSKGKKRFNCPLLKKYKINY